MKSNKKMPWHIWLSVIGLFMMWGSTYRHILFASKNEKNFDRGHLWIMASTHLIFIFFVFVMLPTGAVLIISDAISPIASDSIKIVLEFVPFLTLYFSGVYAASRHSKWRERNL